MDDIPVFSKEKRINTTVKRIKSPVIVNLKSFNDTYTNRADETARLE